MHDYTSEQVLAVLTIPPSLETQLIDWLLALDITAGFSSCAVNGHGSRHDHLSIAEQVIGRQHRLQLQVQLDRAHLELFIRALAGEFATADLHYWITPLLAAGRLGEQSDQETPSALSSISP